MKKPYEISDVHYEKDAHHTTLETTRHTLDLLISGKVNGVKIEKFIKLNTLFQRGYPFYNFLVSNDEGKKEILEVTSTIRIRKAEDVQADWENE